MKLSAYCAGRTDRKKTVADACEVTLAAVTHWCNGTRFPKAEHWRDIERATEGKVTAADWLDSQEAKAA